MVDLHGKRIHFMGIGGIGMSALAEMAAHAGATVTGCDRAASSLTKKLETRGIPVSIGHDPAHAAHTDIFVHTSAVPPSHPERLAADERQEQRGKFLARFLDARPNCGICGTHGKTTTSWLLAHILIHAGLDPAVYIGGIVPQLENGNFRIGNGPFVAELDESDGTFLYPHLSIAVIANIDSDHLSHYRDDAALDQAFSRFAANVAENGLLVAGIDNARARAIFDTHRGRKISFGFDKSAMLRAEKVELLSDGSVFHIVSDGGDMGPVSISMTGNHAVQNVLAATAAALEWNVRIETIREALATVRGVLRRMELLGHVHGVPLYSDYAHHPAEMAATLQALRQQYDGRILLVFQPHLFSRTRDYADDFAAQIASADAALVLDIYPAREEPIEGVDASMLVEKAALANPEVQGPFALDAIEQTVMDMSGGFAAVVFMGAGDIDAAGRNLAAYSKQMDALL